MPTWWAMFPAGPPVLAVMLASLSAWRRRWTVRHAASEADQMYATDDALRSAIELSEQPDDPFVRVAVERGEDAAAEIDAARVVPRMFHRSWIVWPFAAAAVASIWLYMPRLARDGVDKGVTRMDVADAIQDIRRAAAQDVADEPSPSANGEASRSQMDDLHHLEEELAAGRIGPLEARSRAAEALHAEADRQAARLSTEQRSADDARARLAEAARASRATEAGPSGELKRALAKGDVDAAAQAVERLRHQAPALSAKEREKLADDLTDLSNAMDKDGAVQDEAIDSSTNEKKSTAMEREGNDGRSGVHRENSNAQKQVRDALRDASRALREEQEKHEGTRSAERPKGYSSGSPDHEKSTGREETTPSKQMTSKNPGRAPEESPKREDKDSTSSNPTSPNTRPDTRKGPDSPGKDPKDPPPEKDSAEGAERDATQPGQTRGVPDDTHKPTRQAPTAPASETQKRGEPSNESGKDPAPYPSSSSPATGAPKQASNDQRETREQKQGATPSDGMPGSRQESHESKPLSNPETEKQVAPNSDTTAPPQARHDGNSDSNSTQQLRPGDTSRANSESKSGGTAKQSDPKTRSSPEGEQNKPGPSHDVPGQLPQIPKMSDEAMEQLAKRFRDLSKNFDRNAPSQQQIDRLRKQAQDILEKSTPEQREQLERIAKKLARETPSESSSEPDTPNAKSPPDDRKDGARDESLPKRGDSERSNGSPERDGDQESSSDGELQAGRAPPRPLPAGAARPNSPSMQPGNDGPTPSRRIGPTPQPWSGETETVDARPKSTPEGATPRVLAEVLSSDSRRKRESADGSMIRNELREAAKGADRAIEQQGVPTGRSEYIRRVFRRYVERASPSSATMSSPEQAKSTPDAPDASKNPKK